MRISKFTISWIYGEFRIARMQGELAVEKWTASFPVHDLQSLNKALDGASEHMDLSRGGEVTIVYEDDLHTHDVFEVPKMSKRDLEKSLLRKVIQNKPFEDKAAWCYHEAKHNDNEEGILLHIMPQNIVDAIVRLCQEFYLTPRQLVPLTEVVSSITRSYHAKADDILVVVALFNKRTEILVTLGTGEVLFVRELPYSGFELDSQRLIVDINRTMRYAKQKIGNGVSAIWLIGEKTDQLKELFSSQVEGELHFDPNGLDPFHWAVEVSKLKGQLSANFIPLLAQKKINRTLFYRVVLWMFAILTLVAISVTVSVEYALAKQAIKSDEVAAEITRLNLSIEKIDAFLRKSKQSKQKLQLLQGSADNLPALFVNHLGDIVPNGLTLTDLKVQNIAGEWEIELSGESKLGLNEIANVLQKFEQAMQNKPWNISITKSWKIDWYAQLQSGAASGSETLGFEINGRMK